MPQVAEGPRPKVQSHNIQWRNVLRPKYVMVWGIVKQTWHATTISKDNVIRISLLVALEGNEKMAIFFSTGAEEVPTEGGVIWAADLFFTIALKWGENLHIQGVESIRVSCSSAVTQRIIITFYSILSIMIEHIGTFCSMIFQIYG